MRKVVLTYGIIAGFIISIFIVLMGLFAWSDGDFSGGEVLGYSSMIITFSMIFFGIRSYRQNMGGGYVTFGRAFLIGLYITIIASVFYVITWKIYSAIALPDFADKYAACVINNAKKSGASAAVIAEKTKDMEDWKKLYANPFYEIGMTFMEIFPVGLVVSLVCAAILRKKTKVTAAK